MNSSNTKKGNAYVHPSTIEFYAMETWRFAKSILWHSTPFPPEELDLAFEYLRDYFRAISPERFALSAPLYFRKLCERVLRANYRSDSGKNFKHLHPCIFFGPMTNELVLERIDMDPVSEESTKPMTVKDLAQKFGISRPTMRLWLKSLAPLLGKRIGNKYNSQQVQIILKQLASR